MLYFAILAMATLCLASCSKSVTDDDDNTAITAGQGNSNLSILTRAGEGEGSVAYPVVLYVFNSSNQCVAVKTLADETAELTIEGLKADTYNVFAIGGADNTRYSLPTQANATPTTLITLLEGKVHEDLMTGRNTVVIGDDEDNQLTLALQRKVAMVKQVEVKMVPADAEAVSLVITPLREAFQLNGEYSGEAGSFTQGTFFAPFMKEEPEMTVVPLMSVSVAPEKSKAFVSAASPWNMPPRRYVMFGIVDG